MPKSEEKQDKTKKKPPKSPTKKETLLKVACISKNLRYAIEKLDEDLRQDFLKGRI